MEVYRLGVKFFVADSPHPASLKIRDFVPIFHSWIQKQAIEGHLLVDVHDYSHIHQGPGILLVAHEGNFSLDQADGRLGLLYYRKQASSGTPEERVAAIVKTATQACRLIENEPSLGGSIRFRTDELMLVANDRLLAPNDKKTFSEMSPVLTKVFGQVLKSNDITLTHVSRDPRSPLTIRVQSPS